VIDRHTIKNFVGAQCNVSAMFIFHPIRWYLDEMKKQISARSKTFAPHRKFLRVNHHSFLWYRPPEIWIRFIFTHLIHSLNMGWCTAVHPIHKKPSVHINEKSPRHLFPLIRAIERPNGHVLSALQTYLQDFYGYWKGRRWHTDPPWCMGFIHAVHLFFHIISVHEPKNKIDSNLKWTTP
jgi:hypothetical protein